jgi:hypothetical protein
MTQFEVRIALPGSSFLSLSSTFEKQRFSGGRSRGAHPPLAWAYSGQQPRWSLCSLTEWMQESCHCEAVIQDLFLVHYFLMS